MALNFVPAIRHEIKFDAPQKFRPDRAPNRLIALGIGPHMRIGMSLSRMQARITRQQLLRALALCAARPPQRARWTNFGVTALLLRLTGQ